MTSKFPGTCVHCGDRIPVGALIEYVDKKAFHADCYSGKTQNTLDGSGLELAERLGYVQLGWDAILGRKAISRELADRWGLSVLS